MSLKDEKTKQTYHCYDCGGVWDKDGVDISRTKDLTRYTCKECRGRCIPKAELGRVKGVKSIRQRFGNGKITLVLLAVILTIIILNWHNQRVTMNDYQEYLRETASLRTVINSKLQTYREDYKIIQNSKEEKIKKPELVNAQSRIAAARKYISNWDYQIDEIIKPETPEVLDLYTIETTFWKDPSYVNYISYQATMNKLKRKYGRDYFEILKETVRKRTQKKLKHLK